MCYDSVDTTVGWAVEHTDCIHAKCKTFPQRVDDTKQSDGETSVMLELWGI